MKFLVLYFGNCNALNGAAKFIKALVSNKEFWKANSIEIIDCSNSDYYIDVQEYKKTLIFKIKRKIKMLLSKTKYGKRISFFQYNLKTMGGRSVDKASKYIDDNTVVLLNDLFVADQFYQKYSNKAKTIFLMHNGGDPLSMLEDYFEDKKSYEYLKRSGQNILQKADRIVFVSPTAREKFSVRYSKYKDKTAVIYNGIDSQKKCIKIDDDKLRLVTVGTVCERKNQIDLLKAIRDIGDEEIELTVVGDGPQYEICKKFVTDYGLNSQIKMVGAQTDVFHFLEKSNTFIMASKDEGLPIAAQEAMSIGLPLILTDVGGCRDLIKDNGLLLKPDYTELIASIKFARDNLMKLKNWGLQSYNHYLDKFTVKGMQSQYADMVKELSKEIC